MDEPTQEVVEENNQPAPTDETTLTDQPVEESTDQPEQATEESEQSEESSEPSESPEETEPEREVKRQPRVERRFNQMTRKLAEVSKKAQPQAANFLPTEMPRIEPGMEYGAEDLDNILTQKAQVISQANTAQLVAAMQQQQTVNQYVNSMSEDTAELRSKYDVLNPDSPAYDPNVEEAIAELYERANPIERNGQLNPNVDLEYRLKTVAERYLGNVERYRTKGQAESSKELQAAADNAVLPPSGDLPSTPADDVEALREKLADYKF